MPNTMKARADTNMCDRNMDTPPNKGIFPLCHLSFLGIAIIPFLRANLPDKGVSNRERKKDIKKRTMYIFRLRT